MIQPPERVGGEAWKGDEILPVAAEGFDGLQQAGLSDVGGRPPHKRRPVLAGAGNHTTCHYEAELQNSLNISRAEGVQSKLSPGLGRARFHGSEEPGYIADDIGYQASCPDKAHGADPVPPVASRYEKATSTASLIVSPKSFLDLMTMAKQLLADLAKHGRGSFRSRL